MAWSRAGRTAFGEMPFDAHVLDIASGTLPLDVAACYLAGTLAFLFAASKLVALRCFVGRGQFLARAASVAAVALAFAAAALVVSLAMAVDATFELPAAGGAAALSARTRSILAETSGRVTVTCFLPRGDARFKPVGRFLRRLRRESASVGGARVEISYVDPRWDIGAAERLIRRGGLAWGCDRYLLACPKNRGVKRTQIEAFQSDVEPMLTAENLDRLLQNRAFAWRGRAVLERNLALLQP